MFFLFLQAQNPETPCIGRQKKGIGIAPTQNSVTQEAVVLASLSAFVFSLVSCIVISNILLREGGRYVPLN